MKIKYLLILIFITFTCNQIMAQNYASMYLTNGSTDLISGTLTADTWQQVTGFAASENNANWSFASNQLTALTGSAGKYLVRYSLSFTANIRIWTIAVMKNGVEQSELTNTRKIGSKTDVGNVSGAGFIEISDGDIITFQASADNDADEFFPIHAQLVLVELDEAATPDYAEMYINSNSSEQSIPTSFAQIINYSAGSTLEGWSFSSNQLTAQTGSAGKYLIIYSMSFSGDGPVHYDFGLSINGGNPDKILLRRTISASGNNFDIGNVVATGIINVTDGSILSIRGKANGSNKHITAIYSNLSLIKIASTNNPKEYSDMYIADNSTATTISSGWNKEVHFTAGSNLSNNWTFSSSSLVADSNLPEDFTNDGTGIYLVNYYMGISLTTDGTVKPEITIFLNETEQSNLINKRLLPIRANDVGSISGTGIITVSSSIDKITLRMKDPDNQSINFIVKNANVNLFRVKEIPTVPVELTSFTATAIAKGIILNWSTATEVNNYGFSIERKSGIDNREWDEISFVEGHGNSNSPKDYSFIDASPVNGNLSYRLKQIDTDGAFEYSDVATVTLANLAKNELNQNHPNPFNPSTAISFSLAELAHVNISVYNVIGQKVAELANEEMDAGFHNVNFDGSSLSTGFYFYRLETPNYSKTMKMILLR